MRIKQLSPKQRALMLWAFRDGQHKALICDGAVRSGKTVCMATAFILWAMRYFRDANFGICGKTVQSAERNIIRPAQSVEDLTDMFGMQYRRSDHMLTVYGNGRKNNFYVFGGKDESSYTLIQGITLSGVLFDEVALMPQSFVDQGIARTLSVPEARLWFNCNPESPGHWFFKEWVQQPEQKDALHMHFVMSDNPIMSADAIQKAERMYSGVFYDRYIRGLWVLAEGIIYPMFGASCIAQDDAGRKFTRYVVSMDYGTQNPTAMLLWGFCDGVWYEIREYYHSGRETGQQKTDTDYYAELEKLVGEVTVEYLVIDPSAASFIALVRQKHRFKVRKADNAVLDGIRKTASCLSAGKIKVCACCERTIQEYGLYVWDAKAQDDRPIKDNDHAMDATRYFVATMGVWKERSDYKPLWM